MNQEPLPPELASLEERLSARSAGAGASSDEFRRRVLAAMGDELAAPKHAAGAMDWRAIAAIAAVIVLGLNLAITASSVTNFLGDSGSVSSEIAVNYRAARELDPLMSPAEAHRIALLVTSAQRLPRLPQPPPSAQKEQSSELNLFGNGARQ